MSTALHHAEDPVDEVGEGCRGDAICGADVVMHALKEGEQETGGSRWETGTAAFDHSDRRYHAVVAGRCVIVEDTSIHARLADDVVGEAFE